MSRVKRPVGFRPVANFLALAAVLSACSRPPDLSGGFVSIGDYGANPTPGFDNTPSILNAISAAQSMGIGTVSIPGGTYDHVAFSYSGVSLVGSGSQSVLRATDPSNARIDITGNGTSLSNLTVLVLNAATRNGLNDGILINGASDFSVTNVTVQGPEGTCIKTMSSTNGRIIGNTCMNSLADGIHTTGASSNMVIAGNTTTNTGDDAIAIVSYNGRLVNQPVDSGPTHNILVQGNQVGQNSFGRGLSVVGGYDVTIQGNQVSYVLTAPGIYVAQENSAAYITFGVSNVKVIGNSLSGIYDSPYDGAIAVESASDVITDILIQGNTVQGTDVDGFRTEVNGAGAADINIAVIGNIFSGVGSGLAVNLWNNTATNVYCSGNSLDGSAINDASCGGNYDFTVTGSSLTYP